MPEPGANEREAIARALAAWYEAWRAHDLESVLSLLHDDVRFEHWDGSVVVGKSALRRAWSGWFAGRDFHFAEEETFVDAGACKALFRWRLTWPAPGPDRRGEFEVRRGVDVLHFLDARIIRKLTYTKTTVTAAGRGAQPA